MPPRGKRSAPEPVQPRRGKALKGIEPEPVPAELGVNAEIQAALSKCDDIILEKWSKGILTDQPTALSGVPEYNAARAKAALDGGNKYTASVPLYWLNLKFEMQPGVPRYRSRIDSLEKHFFESPAHMMAPLTVCLNSGEYPHECIGALNPVDPSELRDALRQAVARAITDKQPAATLRKWRDVLMSTVVEFEVMDDKNRIQKTFSTIVQRREDIGVWHENTRVTSLLRIYEVMDLKRQLEDVSGKQNKKSLAAHYERIKYCQKSEQVTVGWVEVAQMLHGCALQNPVVLKVLTSFDQLPSNPIDTVYKMREICVQSDKRPDHMEWSFVMLWDWWTNCEGCEISQRELKEGSRYPVSLIRLFLAKKSLRDWLWRNMESNFMWESTVKQSIRDVTKDLPTMRRHFGFYDDPSAQVAFADRGSWPESADLYVQLFEAVVYGYRFDHHLGQSLKNHKTADDVFNHSDVKPMMSKVLAAYEKETGSTPDTVEEEVPLDVQTLLAADNVHLSLPESLIKAAEESPGGKDFEGCAAVEAGVRAAQRRVQGQIQLIVDCDEGLADLLRETKAAQMTGDPEAKSYVAVVFDGKVACESGSQAKYRLPPLRQPQLKRLVGAYLALRDGELADGDVFVMLDGGKGPTFEDSVTKVVGKKLQASKTTVVYTFESCEARLERASKQTLDMVETVSMPTHDGFSAKVQPRLFSESNTRGNAIAGLARPQWTDAKAVWNVSMAQKRSILGPTNMPLPGGACPVEHEQESKVKDSDVVPAFYHESPHTLAAELGHYLCVRAIIDLTPGSGHWAAWSVRKRVPYAGVCMTEKHAELLTKRLVTKTVEAMMDPNDEDLYDSAYTALIEKLQGANNQQGVTEAQNQGNGKGRGGRGGRGGKGTGKQRGVQQQDGGAGAADEASSGSGGLSRDELLKKITEAAAAGAADDA